MTRTGGIRHNVSRPNIGMKTEIYITPDDVNFHKIQHKEVDVGAVCTGVYSPFNGHGHDANPATISETDQVMAGKGTKSMGVDEIYSGDPGTAPPFTPGHIDFNIPYQFRVGSGAWKQFATILQRCELGSGGALSASKAGATASKNVSDPTSSY